MHADHIQNEIEEKGLDAPRVRPEDLEAEIASEVYFTAAEGVRGRDHDAEIAVINASPKMHDRLMCLTFCVLVLKNGITVTGQSDCVSPENFDAEIDRKIARKNAVEQLWPLLGFRLADKLATG